jgi:hypothetical protein
MRWTKKKLRNLLMESNYKLPKGYSVIKRSRSLNGDMSLSFLSGDAGINPVKAFEARAYAKDSARKLRRAIELQKQDMEIGLLGLDEIGNKAKRQERRQARQEKREAKRGGSPAPSMPESEGDSGEGLEPTAPTTGGGTRRQMRQERRATRKANRAIRKGGGMKDLVRKGAGLLPGEPLSPGAEAQAESAERSAMEAGRATSEGTTGGGLFRGRNLLIIGGVALLAIGGIYFLTKKK